jgi:hypothetical protein
MTETGEANGINHVCDRVPRPAQADGFAVGPTAEPSAWGLWAGVAESRTVI